MAAIPLNFEIVRKQFKRYQAEIRRILINGQTRPFAYATDDAKQLQYGHTWETLLQPARDLLKVHQLRTNNPHGETAASVGTMTAAAITALANTKMAPGFLPLSHYGFTDALSEEDVAGLWTKDGFRLEVSDPVSAMMSGSVSILPPTTFDLTSLFPSRYTKNTFDVAVVQKLGVIGYKISEVRRAPIPIRPIDTLTYMYIGTVVTGDLGITSMAIARAIRIDGLRLSELPVGSGIPTVNTSFGASNVKLKTGW